MSPVRRTLTAKGRAYRDLLSSGRHNVRGRQHSLRRYVSRLLRRLRPRRRAVWAMAAVVALSSLVVWTRWWERLQWQRHAVLLALDGQVTNRTPSECSLGEVHISMEFSSGFSGPADPGEEVRLVLGTGRACRGSRESSPLMVMYGENPPAIFQCVPADVTCARFQLRRNGEPVADGPARCIRWERSGQVDGGSGVPPCPSSP